MLGVLHEKKSPKRSRAESLYISPWFKKVRKWIFREGISEWYILSGKHKLLDPQEEIEPYEFTIKDKGTEDQKKWANDVFKKLKDKINSSDRVVIYAPAHKREFLVELLRQNGNPVEVPMAGLRQGEQLKWLNEQNGDKSRLSN